MGHTLTKIICCRIVLLKLEICINYYIFLLIIFYILIIVLFIITLFSTIFNTTFSLLNFSSILGIDIHSHPFGACGGGGGGGRRRNYGQNC